jgi:UDP-glucose 4-epimerase
MRVLVTGGAGYIGSHTVLELIENGHEPIVVDNFVNSSPESLRRVEELAGQPVESHNFDVRDAQQLTTLLQTTPVEATIHFAALKAVGESVEKPLDYYRNNLDATLSVLEAVQATRTEARPGRVIFSSSATVYGDPQELPITESSPVGVGITNPYGWTKLMGEQFLKDVCVADSSFQAIALRYFNPIGAHASGRIGEDPGQIPNNLAPYISQVASGKLERIGIFGNDYDTPDGTGVRDYIHVMDLAAGHVAALNYSQPGFHAINLGTGKGTSVLELICAFEAAVGHALASAILPRRPGDIAECYADTALAEELLCWRAQRSIADACADAWRWQSANPAGYA